ncbi:amphi-Trp domain-containing protein [Natronoarchaeum sp. GCM10025703]|uniref:amphi-Trp domain-containing protein n=1 Tax=Natronoarchaeum sp. GCM10025703 TaxID=3252685 RepID=UPI00361EA0EB
MALPVGDRRNARRCCRADRSRDSPAESTDQSETVTVPEEPTFEVELERLTDSETGEQRYELEYELHWTE